MDEIIKLVTEKAGISPDQAQKAVTTVLGFLKQKLPAAMAEQLDKVVAGGGAGTGGMANAAEGAVGGLFGTK